MLGNESQRLLVVKLCYRCIEAFTSDAYLLAAGLVPISAIYIGGREQKLTVHDEPNVRDRNSNSTAS